MKSNISPTRDHATIERFAEELGCSVETRKAQTGTYYITVYHDRLDESLEVRVANHGDAYGTANYTVDGLRGTMAGCRTWLLDQLCTSHAVLKRLRRARRAMNKRQAEAGKGACPLLDMADGFYLLQLANGKMRMAKQNMQSIGWVEMRDATVEEKQEANRRWKNAFPQIEG